MYPIETLALFYKKYSCHTTSKKMKILYFGAYNLVYPRNSILRHGLILHKWDVDICQCAVNINPIIQNWILLKKTLSFSNKNWDAIYLAERGQNVALLAWILSRLTSKPLIVDFLYSRYNTQTEKRGVLPDSFSGKILWLLDWLSLLLGDLVICDTKSHITYYASKFYLNPTKAIPIYLGVETDIYKPRIDVVQEKKSIFFWGSYTPSHGTEIIVKTADLLKDRTDIEFFLIGNGSTYKETVKLAKSLNLSNVSFVPWMKQEELAELASRAYIVIGAVGKTPKAMRCICFKEFQGAAMKRPVITAETPAAKEVFTHGENIIMCAAADPSSLAAAIVELLTDDQLRKKISNNGYELIVNYYSTEKIGETLSNTLVNFLENMPRNKTCH
jgi:glycosyltransferase involved in cell wall biosynthesis